MPLHPQLASYDLVVEAHRRLYRVQVKRARWRAARKRKAGWGDRACFTVQLGRSSETGASQGRRLQRDEFDILCVVCDPETLYVIPVEKVLRDPYNGELLLHLEFKPPIDNGRRDSATAAARWLPYLNRFNLDGESVE